MNPIKKLSLLLSALLVGGLCFPAAASDFTVRTAGTLPPPASGGVKNPGVAGAFIGGIGDRIVVAGGSNFAQGAPWDGGAKQFEDAIYLLTPSGDACKCELAADAKLPAGIAHGCAAVAGRSLYCFGGLTAQGESRAVYALTPVGNSVRVDAAGELPAGFRPAAALAYKDEIYIHGVTDGANAFWRFSPVSGKWTELAACPGAVRSVGPAFAAQHNGRENAMYLIGGRHEKDGELQLCSDVWEYLPVHDKWQAKGDVTVGGKPAVVMYAAAVPYGSGHVLVFGGDDGRELLRRAALERAIGGAATPQEAESLRGELREAFTGHEGFSKELLAYHAITNTWVSLGEARTGFPAVSTAVVAGGGIVIPSGEIRPGVRTPDVQVVTIRETAEFGWGNYSVIIAYLLVMMGIGVYFVRKNNTTDQFFKGGAKIPWWAAGISIFATALSAITFISIPAKAYGADWGMFMFNMTILMIVPIVIHYYLPFFRKLNVASAYQYLEQRFSSPVRYLASVFFCFFMFARIAIVLFLPSLALNAVTGIDVYTCILLMVLVTIAYCTMGGIEAVVWADVVQGVILVGGALVSLVYLINGIEGGFSGMVDVAVTDDKFNILNFAFDLTQPVFWVTLVGGLANQLLAYTSDQSVIQRYITVKDTAGTKKGLWLNGFLSIPIAVIFFMIGTALYVFFKQQPELLSVGMSNTDSIFPHFIMCRLPVGIAGLLIAAIFSAAMSTLSANINSTATVLTEDFYRRFRKGATDKQAMGFARLSGIVVGGLGLLMAILLATFDIASLWDQFNFFLGLLTSGLGGLFMMGIFTERIGTRSAFAGFVGSIVILLIVNSYSNVSFLLYGFIGLASCFLIGYLSSFVFGRGK